MSASREQLLARIRLELFELEALDPLGVIDTFGGSIKAGLMFGSGYQGHRSWEPAAPALMLDARPEMGLSECARVGYQGGCEAIKRQNGTGAAAPHTLELRGSSGEAAGTMRRRHFRGNANC